jgi:hypothetical protein
MSGRKLLLDSNIVIYIAKKELAPEVFVKADDTLYLSDVSYMETVGYAFSDESEKQAIEILLSVLFRFPIEEVVVQKVIALRQSRRMKLPDAIIAATALIHDCVLVTRNISDFSGLPGLTILNPFDM